MKYNIITIKKFLENYCNIENENLDKLTHKDLKTLMPHLKRCSFEFMDDNYDLIEKGEIIVVKDKIGNKVPYLKPKFIEVQDKRDYVNIEITSEKEIALDLEDLTIYELQGLLKRTKKISTLKKVKNELLLRGYGKKSKKRRLIEEELYGKHKRK